MMAQFYHEILLVSEDEMKHLEVGPSPPGNEGYPAFYCVTPAGALRLWPKLDPKYMQLFAFGGEKK